MKTVSCSVAICILSICGPILASVEVTNPRAVMPASRIIRSGRRALFSARLSPDGRYILFPKLADRAKQMYRLVLFDTVSNKESEIAVDFPEGYESVFTRFNFFSPSGDKIALFSMKQGPGPRLSELVIYDVAAAKLTSPGISGPSVMGQFDSTGKRLLVSKGHGQVSLVSLDDPNTAVSLVSGWTHSCSPYSSYATVFGPPNPGERRGGLTLLNLKDNSTFQLPVHERNGRLDDVTSQWNLDGRYVLYIDVVQKGRTRFDQLTRVWDVTTKTEKATIPDAFCIGPGPASHLMVMMSTEGDLANRILIYDLNTGKLTPAGPPSAEPIHAWNKRILYAAPGKDGKKSIFIADMKEANN